MARHPLSPIHMGVEAARVDNSQSSLALTESTPEGHSLVNIVFSIVHFVHLGMLMPK